MHGRPREFKKKLQDPKAQAGYAKKVCTRGHKHAERSVTLRGWAVLHPERTP